MRRQGLRPEGLATLVAALLVLCGCAGGGGPTPPGLPSLASLPKLPSAAPATGPEIVDGTPTEVYTSIARGALACWFGATGPLKGKYIYHAEAEPPSKGGKSEIVIRTRDDDAADPRSLRAFRVGILTNPEQRTQVEVENFTIPEPLLTQLKTDTSRWATGAEGCGEAPMTAGWSAEAAAAAAAAKGQAATTKKPASTKKPDPDHKP